MKNRQIWCGVLLMVCLTSTPLWAAEEWTRLDLGLGGVGVRSVFLDARGGGSMLVATTGGVFSAPLLASTHQNAQVVFHESTNMAVSDQDGRLWCATDRGLLRSGNGEHIWNRLSHGCKALSVLVKDGKAYFGTDDGLFVSFRGGEDWRRVDGPAGHSYIQRLVDSSWGVLVLTTDRLFLLAPGQDAVRSIFSELGEEGMEKPEGGLLEEEDQGWLGAALLDVAAGEEGIYLVARDGLHVSHDGHTWQNVGGSALPWEDLSSVAVVREPPGRDYLCVGSSYGVYCGRNGHFIRSYQGLNDNDIVRMAASGNIMAAATVHEVYVREILTDNSAIASGGVSGVLCQRRNGSALTRAFKREPSIGDVQKMAVAYADVDKAKIDAWHRQSRWKAVIPHISVGADRASGNLFHWDTGTSPDSLQKGRASVDWDVSMTWQLSDLVWSSDHTSIDSRSKLMVELRNEVLDQVTRIYFERRRLQAELDACLYADEGDRLSVEMRVDELTALIDGYTGGRFSDKASRNSFQQH